MKSASSKTEFTIWNTATTNLSPLPKAPLPEALEGLHMVNPRQSYAGGMRSGDTEKIS